MRSIIRAMVVTVLFGSIAEARNPRDVVLSGRWTGDEGMKFVCDKKEITVNFAAGSPGDCAQKIVTELSTAAATAAGWSASRVGTRVTVANTDRCQIKVITEGIKNASVDCGFRGVALLSEALVEIQGAPHAKGGGRLTIAFPNGPNATVQTTRNMTHEQALFQLELALDAQSPPGSQPGFTFGVNVEVDARGEDDDDDDRRASAFLSLTGLNPLGGLPSLHSTEGRWTLRFAKCPPPVGPPPVACDCPVLNTQEVRFGPECAILIDPANPRLCFTDPRGFKFQFGPVAVESGQIELGGPECRLLGGQGGIVASDPIGFRVLNPDPATGPSRIVFGPTDDCSIGIDPTGGLSGLIERDPVGFRLLGRDQQGCRLIFGPTMDCTVEVDPAGPTGLLLRDPRGIRLLSPDPTSGPTLLFGPTDDCSLSIDPTGRLAGLIERDPVGFRLLGRDDRGCRLIFGPTMDCTVEVDPAGPPGLLLRDPRGIRILNPDLAGRPQLLFGPTDECRILADPDAGLQLDDPNGVTVSSGRLVVSNIGSSGQDGVIQFDDQGLCAIVAGGQDPTGGARRPIRLRDPGGVRVENPLGGPNALELGEADCRIVGIPGESLCFSDPRGFKFLGTPPIPGAHGRGTLAISNIGSSGLDGVSLDFGGLGECTIAAGGVDPNSGAVPPMQFRDPSGFCFFGDVEVKPPFQIIGEVVSTSGRRFKENVKPIEDALEKINELQGVYFTWKEEYNGKNDLGFIAEDVAKVLPELVTWEADGTTARGLNYDHIVAVAVEGVKAQQQQIDRLASENAAMEEELTAMKKQLAELASQIAAMRGE